MSAVSTGVPLCFFVDKQIYLDILVVCSYLLELHSSGDAACSCPKHTEQVLCTPQRAAMGRDLIVLGVFWVTSLCFSLLLCGSNFLSRKTGERSR